MIETTGPFTETIGPLIAGLDPGAKGGFALLSGDGGFQLVHPLPETEREITELLAEYAPAIERCFLEAVHSWPGQGVSSMFAFGRSYGLLRGILLALKIPFEDVSPMKWILALGLQAKRKRGRPVAAATKKRLHRSWAQQWFPQLAIDDRTADALLIAEYGRRQLARPPLLEGVEMQKV